MKRILLSLVFIATLATVYSNAQIRRDTNIGDPDSSRPDRLPPMSDPQREIIERSVIARSVAEHRETIQRAEENARLGAELRDRFATARAFGREELRRLERMESLSRRIRNAAGGSNVALVLEREPRELSDALSQLAERAERFKETVERTPRRVVSAQIIEQANELLTLIDRIRGFIQP
jgi:hypothetical protein